MEHQVKVTVLDKKLYPKLQERCCAGCQNLRPNDTLQGVKTSVPMARSELGLAAE